MQTYGDRAGVYRNNTLILGTTGQAKRLERIKIRFNNQTGYDGSIEYRVHRQTYGWTNWVKNNQFAGTKGEAKRLEGIQIRLTGEIAEHYSIRYRVHIQTYGWSRGWQYDGALAGTEGEAKRLESLKCSWFRSLRRWDWCTAYIVRRMAGRHRTKRWDRLAAQRAKENDWKASRSL